MLSLQQDPLTGLNTTAPAKEAWEGIKQIPQPETSCPLHPLPGTQTYVGPHDDTHGEARNHPSKGKKDKFYPDLTLGSQHWSRQLNNFHFPSFCSKNWEILLTLMQWRGKGEKGAAEQQWMMHAGSPSLSCKSAKLLPWPRGSTGKTGDLQRPNPAKAVWVLLLLLQESVLLHSLGQGECPRQEQSHPMPWSCTRGGLDWILGKDFFSERVFKHCNRLLREVVESPCLKGGNGTWGLGFVVNRINSWIQWSWRSFPTLMILGSYDSC